MIISKRDPIQAEVGIAKDIEILELIFDSESEIYNFRISKNTSDVDDRLAMNYERLGVLDEDI